MQEIVVIDGEIELENTLDGEVELETITDLDPEVVLSAGGGVTPSGTIEITDNGVYDVTEYASADVDVQGGITPTGTKQISITQNGTTTEDVTNYASAEINVNVPASAVDTGTKSISTNGTHDVVGYANASVNVPNSYSAGDEGKVVSNGALVAQTSDTVTANDTYDTTLINSLTVNVSGGKTLPSGYTSCNYIQNSGDAYIDTGVRELCYAISGYEGRFAVYIGANVAKTLWGFQGTSVSAYRFTPQINTDNTLKYYGAVSGMSNAISGWNASGINDVKVNCYASETKYPVFNVNGTSTTGNKQNTTTAQNPSQPNIYLMCSNYQGTPLASDKAVDGSYVRCYGFKIFSFDGAIRDFVPCVRNADSVAGFYDFITEAFYPSIGGNAFTYG